MKKFEHLLLCLALLLAAGSIFAMNRAGRPVCDDSASSMQHVSLTLMHIEILGLSFCESHTPIAGEQ